MKKKNAIICFLATFVTFLFLDCSVGQKPAFLAQASAQDMSIYQERAEAIAYMIEALDPILKAQNHSDRGQYLSAIDCYNQALELVDKARTPISRDTTMSIQRKTEAYQAIDEIESAIEDEKNLARMLWLLE